MKRRNDYIVAEILFRYRFDRFEYRDLSAGTLGCVNNKQIRSFREINYTAAAGSVNIILS